MKGGRKMLNNITYTYQIYLNDNQKEIFNKVQNCCSLLYDYLLERTKLYFEATKRIPSSFTTYLKFYNDVKHSDYVKFLEENFNSSISAILYKIKKDVSYSFKVRKELPKGIKKKNMTCSIAFKPQSENAHMYRIGLNKVSFSINLFGDIKMIFHRNFPKGAKCLWAVIKKIHDDDFKIFFILNGEFGLQNKVQVDETSKVLGIDFSIKNFFVSSDESIIPDTKRIFMTKAQSKLLANRSKAITRTSSNSNNRAKAIKLYVNYYEKIIDKRNQYFDELAKLILNKYDIIAIEDINLNELRKNKHYSKKIDELAFRTFISTLNYHAKLNGKEIIKVDKYFPSSQICNECGYRNERIKVYEKNFICENCKSEISRDKNAAYNIRDEGYRIFLAMLNNRNKN